MKKEVAGNVAGNRFVRHEFPNICEYIDEIASVENKNLSQHPPSYIASHFPTFMGSQLAVIMSEHVFLALSGFTPLVPPRLTQVYQFKKCHEKALEPKWMISFAEMDGNGDLFFTDM